MCVLRFNWQTIFGSHLFPVRPPGVCVDFIFYVLLLWNSSLYSHETSHTYWSWSLDSPKWNSQGLEKQDGRQSAVLNSITWVITFMRKKVVPSAIPLKLLIVMKLHMYWSLVKFTIFEKNDGRQGASGGSLKGIS